MRRSTVRSSVWLDLSLHKLTDLFRNEVLQVNRQRTTTPRELGENFLGGKRTIRDENRSAISFRCVLAAVYSAMRKSTVG